MYGLLLLGLLGFFSGLGWRLYSFLYRFFLFSCFRLHKLLAVVIVARLGLDLPHLFLLLFFRGCSSWRLFC